MDIVAQKQWVQRRRQSLPSQEIQGIQVWQQHPHHYQSPLTHSRVTPLVMVLAWNVFAWSWSLSFPHSSSSLTRWLCSVGIYQCLLVLPFCSALSNLCMGDTSPPFHDLCLSLVLYPLTANYPHQKRLIPLYWQGQGLMKSKVKLPLTSAGAKVAQFNQRTWGEKQNRRQRQ